jgi:signal transduction histidine kinase
VGIQGMSERVRQLNGQFDIRSMTDGTVVTARLPLTAVPVTAA